MATNTTPAFPATRADPRQVTNTLKFVLNATDSVINGATAAVTILLANSLPVGAVITGITVQVKTNFNSTTNTLSVGTNSATFNNIVNAADIKTGAAVQSPFPTTPTGTAVGPLAADASVSAVYTPTGAAATTGSVVVVITYEGGISPS